MKLRYKILLILLVVSLVGISLVYYSILKYNAIFKDTLGKQTSEHANAIIYEIDREIYERIRDSTFHANSLYVIEEIQKSNSQFENMSDRENYIYEIDHKWAAHSSEISPLIEEILSNKGSIRLKDIQEFYSTENSTGYPEIFVTNRYGALVSSTGETSDYRQNDEEWWLNAKENEIYVEGPGYDESSKSVGLIIANAIKDKQGNFIGVIKEVVSEDKLKKIIEEASSRNHNTESKKEIKLLSKEGQLIYQSDNTPYNVTDFSNYSFFKKLDNPRGFILTKEEWHEEDKNEEIMITYAKSEGYGGFRGFGWIILIENKAKEVLSPAESIKNNLIIFSLIFSLILIGFGILFSYKLTRSLKIITEESKKISKGDLDTEIKIKSKDEIGELAFTFNQMVRSLREYQKRLLASEKEHGKRLEEEVKKKTKELKEKVDDLSNTKIAILNMIEDMSKANEELKELDKAKSNFLNIVSHELKTPLTAIIAHLEVLDDMKKNLTKEELNSLEAIRRNSNSLKMLISNILETARMESGKFELTKEKINLEKLIKEVSNELEVLAKQKEIKITAKIEKISPIEADDLRVKEILNNLITNAIKFTEKGEIIITAKEKEGFVEVSVKDTGVGISKDNMNNLFKKFYQVDASVSRRYGGTGLGLSITKQLVEAHGGEIEVNSIEKKGTTFTFTLPIKQGQKSKAIKKLKDAKQPDPFDKFNSQIKEFIKQKGG